MAKGAEWRSRVMVVFLIAAAIFAALVVRNALDGPDRLPLTGRVIIREPAHITVSGSTCTGAGTLAPLAEGARLVITPTGHDPVETELEPGTLSADGACELSFAATVTRATVYRFQVDGLPELTCDHYLIDTQGRRGRIELAPILRWD